MTSKSENYEVVCVNSTGNCVVRTDKGKKKNDILRQENVKNVEQQELEHLKKMRIPFTEEDLAPLLNLFQRDSKCTRKMVKA